MAVTSFTGNDLFKVQVYDGYAYDTITVNVTIAGAPSAGAIAGVSTLCAGATTTYGRTVSGGIWSNSLPGVTSIGAGTGILYGISAGTDVITYSVANGCGTAFTTMPVTVTPLPDAGIISGSTTMCAGNTITLMETVSGGSWSASAGTAISSAGVVTGTTAGTATVSYSVSNACGTSTATYLLTVNSTPAPGTITGIDTVCPGRPVTLAATATGGAWSHTGANTTITAGGIMNGVTSGVHTIVYTVTNACGSARAKFQVYVKPAKICRQGINDQAADPDCIVFPNPNTGTFSVALSGAPSASAVLTVRDMAGRTVLQQAIGTSGSNLVAANLSPGIYVLSVETGDQQWIRKLVVTE